MIFLFDPKLWCCQWRLIQKSQAMGVLFYNPSNDYVRNYLDYESESCSQREMTLNLTNGVFCLCIRERTLGNFCKSFYWGHLWHCNLKIQISFEFRTLVKATVQIFVSAYMFSIILMHESIQNYRIKYQLTRIHFKLI